MSCRKSDWQPCLRNSDSSNSLAFTHTIKGTARCIPNLTTWSHEPAGPSAKQSLWGLNWCLRNKGLCGGHSSTKPSQSWVRAPPIPSRTLGQTASTIKHRSWQRCRRWPQARSGFFLSYVPSGGACCPQGCCASKRNRHEFPYRFPHSITEVGVTDLRKHTACVSSWFSCLALPFFLYPKQLALEKVTAVFKWIISEANQCLFWIWALSESTKHTKLSYQNWLH